MTNSIVKIDTFPSEMDSLEVLLPKYVAEELSGLSPLTTKVRRTDLKKFIQFFRSMYGELLRVSTLFDGTFANYLMGSSEG